MSTITVDNVKKIGQELTELWTDKPRDKYTDDVILRQPEVRLSTTTFEILMWFGQLTELWMDKPNDKERIYMYFTCIACYCVTFTNKLKFGHNIWTACPILKIFSTSCSGTALSFTTQKKIKEDKAFENVDYAISGNLEVRF